jgi:hypothetical protein
MSAARIVYPPMSGATVGITPGRLHKAEQAHVRLVEDSARAHQAADRRSPKRIGSTATLGTPRSSLAAQRSPPPRSPLRCAGHASCLRFNTGTAITLSSLTWHWWSGRASAQSTPYANALVPALHGTRQQKRRPRPRRAATARDARARGTGNRQTEQMMCNLYYADFQTMPISVGERAFVAVTAARTSA